MDLLVLNKLQAFQLLQGLFSGAIVILITILLVQLVRQSFNRFLIKSSQQLKTDPTQYNFVRHLLSGFIYFCGIGIAVYMIPPLRQISISIFAGSGILAVVIGFASQHSIANIVSGMFITIFKPFSVGDRVKLLGKDIGGVVEDITLRHTIIRTFENKRVVVPNSVISTEVVENANLIDEKICKLFEIGISYDSNIDKAMDIMREEAMKHPEALDNRNEEQKANNEPVVATRVIQIAESSIVLRAWVWAKDQMTAFRLGCDLNKTIKERFDKEGIEIPFPYRTIVYRDKK